MHLTQSPEAKKRVEKSRNLIADKADNGISVYGVTTGFGGSADTRTDQPLVLGHSLLQMQHSGVLPSSMTKPLDALPLLDPMGSTTMPESWVRGAILIRMNSLIRGHSGVRWELIEKMKQLLDYNITPVVPLRGSISASGGMCSDGNALFLHYSPFCCKTSRHFLISPVLSSATRRSACLTGRLHLDLVLLHHPSMHSRRTTSSPCLWLRKNR